MTPEKTPIPTDLIREIQRLARLADELSYSAREMGAELDQLQQLLGIKQQFMNYACRAGSTKAN
jgi:hypothetical protein